MVNCQVCGKATNHKTFCSNPCRLEGTRRRNKEGLSPESIEKMRQSLTGKILPDEVKAKMSRSRKAYITEHPEIMKNLLENVESKYTSKIRGKGWRMSRFEALKRDNFTCQSCGEKKKRLFVHHMDYRGRNKPSHTLMNNSLDNLVTMCGSCHNGFHRQKSKDYNERMAVHAARFPDPK